MLTWFNVTSAASPYNNGSIDPACPLLSSDKQVVKPLSLILFNPKARLMSHHYFQAVYRLQHYMIYPYSLLSDLEIDDEARLMWNNSTPNSLQKPYQILRTSYLRNNPQRILLNEPNLQDPSPSFTWFVKLQNSKIHTLADSHESDCPLQDLQQQWENLTQSARNNFRNLATLDMKKYKAQQIEHHFANQGLIIGFDFPDTVPESRLISISIASMCRIKYYVSQNLANKMSGDILTILSL